MIRLTAILFPTADNWKYMLEKVPRRIRKRTENNALVAEGPANANNPKMDDKNATNQTAIFTNYWNIFEYSSRKLTVNWGFSETIYAVQVSWERQSSISRKGKCLARRSKKLSELSSRANTVSDKNLPCYYPSCIEPKRWRTIGQVLPSNQGCWK